MPIFNNMATKKQLEEKIQALEALNLAQENALKKTQKTKSVKKDTGKLVLTTAWQQLATTVNGNPMKNQISVSPNNFDRVRISMKGSQYATKSGFDELHDMLNVAQTKLEKAGLLTQ